jgi:hypothetical protein
MANPKHIEILKRGADAWNEWINENIHIKPDLREADLRGMNLTGCYLTEAELYGADLSGQNLTGMDFSESNLTETRFNRTVLNKAKLVGARLYRSDLIEATLEGADLQATDFRDANLRGANLRGTYLGGAIFTGANLYGADFDKATLNGTTFGDNDLSVVHGLDTVKHGGASVIGINTLYKSNGHIPTTFLRGCGVPDSFISYIPSLFGNAVEFYSCFISHSSKDKEIVQRIYSDLQAAGVRCWLAHEALKAGDDIYAGINEAIRIYDKVLFVLSSNSLKSEWIQIEVEKALQKERRSSEKVLFPIRLDNAIFQSNDDWAVNLRAKYIIDFSNWEKEEEYKKAISRLIRDLKLSIATEIKTQEQWHES